VAAFEKAYPKIKVNLVNAGNGTAEYTKLQNAIKAGSGVPDIAQIEYYAVPQFALGGSLVNLANYGLSSDKSQFSTAIWDSVNVNGQLVGLPQDTGPMTLWYNQTSTEQARGALEELAGKVKERSTDARLLPLILHFSGSSY